MNSESDPHGKSPKAITGLQGADTTCHDDTQRQADTAEEQMAAALDDHLQQLWAGESSPMDPAASDVDSMKSIVSQLHAVGELLESFDASSADSLSAGGAEDPTVIGKYTIRRELGRGGQATTYLAFDPDLERQVVIKLYHGARTGDQCELVLREGRALVRVSSPYVAACFAAEKHEGVPYLVLEYIPGDNLAERCDRRFTVKEAMRLVGPITEGVAAIHACGLVHRDLKPGNILIAEDGKPRIVDFGLAVPIASDELAGISGTPAYMAPEQARGELERIDHRTDLFAVGAVWYQMLTGEPIYHAGSSREMLELARRGDIVPVAERAGKIPRAVAELCDQCLSKEPRNRPPSAARLVELLQRQTRGRGLGFALSLGNWRFSLTIGVATCLVFLAALPLLQLDAPPRVATNTQVSDPVGAPPPGDDPPPVGERPPVGLIESVPAPDDPQRLSFKGPDIDHPVPAPPGVAPKQVELHPQAPANRQPLLEAEARRRLTRGEVYPTGQIMLSPNRACYVRIWLIQNDGDEHLQVFPTGGESDRLEAGESQLVPDTMLDVTLVRDAKHLLVLAAQRPIPKVELQAGSPYPTITQEQIDQIRAGLIETGAISQRSSETVEIVVPVEVRK